MGIATDIERELDRRGWSKYKLAQASGLANQTIQNIIKEDSNPQIDTVLKIAKGFGITVDELVNNPKPIPKIRGKPTGTKEARACLKDLGLSPDDIDLIMVNVKHLIERAKGKGRAATG